MHISIIDDERILGNKLSKRLQNEGFSVTNYYSIRDFMYYGDSTSQLYIVDLSLTDGSGYQVIDWLRNNASCHAPIMIISGHADTDNILKGLNIGADEYMTKPFLFDELLARARALFRRPGVIQEAKKLSFKNILFIPDSHAIELNGHKVTLTKKESQVLEIFMKDIGKVINRRTLITQVWGGSHMTDVSDNTINVTLSKLRRKLGDDFSLKTYYNYGYVLE